TLEPVVSARYGEKLKLIAGTDPYTLPTWSPDVKSLPAVTYPDIVNFLVYSPSAYTLDDLNCYKGLEANNQIFCGWVLHSPRFREKAWIIAEGNSKVLSSHCDCMAGFGESCIHVAALLFASDGTVQIRNSWTVTQEPAYWLLPT
ncbi:hypothetical protein MAR_018613, partial [Mya arenaria]